MQTLLPGAQLTGWSDGVSPGSRPPHVCPPRQRKRVAPQRTRAACGRVCTGFVRGLSSWGTLPCGHGAEELSGQRLEGMRVMALSVGCTNVPCTDDQWPMTR